MATIYNMNTMRFIRKIKRGDHLRDTDFTADKALDELSTMYKVYLRDSQKHFRISRTVPLTKTQETIIKAFDRNLLKDLA